MAAAKGKRSIEEIRAELMKDKHTKDIAKTIGMPLEEYVSLVLEYVKDPKKQPVFNTLPEDQVKAAGGSTMQEVKAWFQGVLDGTVKIKPDRDDDAFTGPKTSSSARKAKKVTGSDA